jgi:APA family basic amino acid/polyamine antiporter
VYFAMAEDGLFPRALARVHPRHGTPGNAIVLQAVWAVVLVFIAPFRELLTFSGTVLLLFSGLAATTVPVLRRRHPPAERPYAAWGYPWTIVFFVAASAAIVALATVQQPRAALGGILVVASGVPAFFLWRRRVQTRA